MSGPRAGNPAPGLAVVAAARRHEPATALFGGPDGLAHLRRLVVDAARVVRPDGWLIFEFGDGQEMSARELISRTEGLTIVDIRHDLQGIARVAIARRHP